jgi:predicted MFS family arabinose efflux permease
MTKAKIITILGIIACVSGAHNYIASLLIPKIASEFSISLTVASGMATSYMLGYGIMQVVYGGVCNFYGKLRMLRVLMVGFLLANIACIFVTSFSGLMICRFLIGFFGAGNVSLPLALIGDLCLEEEQTKYVSRFMSFLILGQGGSCLLGGYFIDYLNYKAIFIVLSLITLIGMVMLYRIKDNTKVRPINFKEIRSQIKGAFTSKYSLPTYTVAFMFGFLPLGFYSFLGTYLKKILLLPNRYVGIMIFYYALSSLFGSYLLSKLARRYSLTNILVKANIIAALAIAGMTISGSLFSTIISIFFIGITFIFMQTSINALAFKINPSAKGLPSAVVGTLLFGGGAVGTAIEAPILEGFGFQALFGMILAAIGIYIWDNKLKKEEKAKTDGYAISTAS